MSEAPVLEDGILEPNRLPPTRLRELPSDTVSWRTGEMPHGRPTSDVLRSDCEYWQAIDFYAPMLGVVCSRLME